MPDNSEAYFLHCAALNAACAPSDRSRTVYGVSSVSQKPKVVVVGATGLESFAPYVLSLSTVQEAAQYLEDPDVVLVLADTAPFTVGLSRRDAVRAHARAGGTVLILATMPTSGALAWDVGDDGDVLHIAAELSLPTTSTTILRTLGLLEDAFSSANGVSSVVAPLVKVYERYTASAPRLAYKSGQLWWDKDTSELLVAGSFAQHPGPLDDEARCSEHTQHPHGMPDPSIRCYAGFSAYTNFLQARAYHAYNPVLEVELSGPVVVAGSPAGDDEAPLLAGHQRVRSVHLRGTCHIQDCASPSTWLGAEEGVETVVQLRELCDTHRSAALNFAPDDLGAISGVAFLYD